MPRPNERAHSIPGALVQVGGFLAKRVDRAVDVGVRPLVEEPHGVEDLAWLLGRRRRVKVDQSSPADRPREDREVAAHPVGQAHRRSPAVPGRAGPAGVASRPRRGDPLGARAERAAQHRQRERHAPQARRPDRRAERGDESVALELEGVIRRAAFHHLRQEIGGGRRDRAGVALEADGLHLTVGAEPELDAQPVAAERVHVLMDRVGPGQLPEVARMPEALQDHAAVERCRHARTLAPGIEPVNRDDGLPIDPS